METYYSASQDDVSASKEDIYYLSIGGEKRRPSEIRRPPNPKQEISSEQHLEAKHVVMFVIAGLLFILIGGVSGYLLAKNNSKEEDISVSYLYLSDTRILELPSFSKASCVLSPYPVEGVIGAISGVEENMLHVCGGMAHNIFYSSCYALNGSRWEERKSMSKARQNAGGSKWGDKWIVTGGWANGRQISSEIFKDGVWKSYLDLPSTNEGHCQIKIGTKLVIAGGWRNGVSRYTYFLDEDSNEWRKLGKMRNGRAYHACVEKDGMMYALGGHQEGSWSSVEKLNLMTGEWSDGPRMPIGVRDVQAVNYEGHIYIVGGWPADEKVKNCASRKIFRLNGNVWEEVSSSGVDGPRQVSSPVILRKDQVICD